MLVISTSGCYCTVFAFLVAAGMIYLDCHQTISGFGRYVPNSFFRSPRVLALATAGGLVAASLDLATTPSGRDPVSLQTGIKQADPLLRAVLVGVVSLALIRSKFLKLAQVDFGGEYIYAKLRERVLLPIVLDWNNRKNRFIAQNVATCLGIIDFLDETLVTVRQTVMAGSPDELISGLSQIEQVKKDRPTKPFSAADAEWAGYYRAVMRLALDSCGPSIFSDSRFNWPR